MALLKEFPGIFIETGEFQINTLTGRFARVIPGLSLAESLQAFLNNHIHSIHRPYFGHLTQLQCAILSAIKLSEDKGGLSLSEIANEVYVSNAIPKNPDHAIRASISRMERTLTKKDPHRTEAMPSPEGLKLVTYDERVVRTREGKFFLHPATFFDVSFTP